MRDCKPIASPLPQEHNLHKTDKVSILLYEATYRNIVGAL